MNWNEWVRIAPRLPTYTYRLGIAPALALLPERMAYGIACKRADLLFHSDTALVELLTTNLDAVFVGRYSAEERLQFAQRYLRLRACETVDIMRLAGNGQALARLVEIRGLEHLDAALAAGHGALLCAAHLGFFEACFALFGMRGYPISLLRRFSSEDDPSLSPIERFYRHTILEQRVTQHVKQNIVPREGQVGVAVLTAKALRQNEVVAAFIDPPPVGPDRARAVPIPFLGGQAPLLAGIIATAERTGSPVIPIARHRARDMYHQTLHILPPIERSDSAQTTLARCLATLDPFIRADPASWTSWERTRDLEALELIRTSAIPK